VDEKKPGEEKSALQEIEVERCGKKIWKESGDAKSGRRHDCEEDAPVAEVEEVPEFELGLMVAVLR